MPCGESNGERKSIQDPFVEDDYDGTQRDPKPGFPLELPSVEVYSHYLQNVKETFQSAVQRVSHSTEYVE